MEEIKVSEMLQADSINKDDSVMIIQEGVNKKAGGSIQTATGTSLSILSVADTCKVKSNSKNIFDKSKITNGYRLDSTGALISQSGYCASDYIPVKPNTTYVSNLAITTNNCVCYFATPTEGSGTRNIDTNPFTTPADCHYIRVSRGIDAIDGFQIEEGSTATDYNPFNTTAIINPFEMEIGGMSAGEPVERTDRIRSKQFIEVYPNTMYTIENALGKYANVYYYDAEQTYIGQYSTSVVATPYSITTPNNCKYIKVMYNYASGDFINSIITGITQILSLTPQGEKLAFTYDSLTNVISDGSVTIEYNTQSRLLNNDDLEPVKEYVDREVSDIYEEGSNENGDYIKYKNGLMICTARKTYTNMVVNTAAGSCYSNDANIFIDFPEAFISRPVVSLQVTGTTTGWVQTFTATGTPEIRTDGFRIFRTTSRTSSTYYIDMIAIGRWK